LFDATSQRAFKVEQVPVKASLVRDLSQKAGVVRRKRQRSKFGGLASGARLRFGQTPDKETEAVVFAVAFEYSDEGEIENMNLLLTYKVPSIFTPCR
jgi:hypothetical protein